MKSSYSALMQSRFFNPAFNSAIFDGPVRIYFAQAQESLALKIYFGLQQQCAQILSDVKTQHQDFGRNVLVMLYPNKESFEMVFADSGDSQNKFIVCESLEEHSVVAINGPFEDVQMSQVISAIAQVLSTWEDLGHVVEPEEIPALQF
jgi:hypothetical protein